MSSDPRLKIITDALRKPSPAHQSAAVLTGRTADGCGLWRTDVPEMALRVYTALYGRPTEQATLAEQLTTAPWYPAQIGDIVHIHYEGSHIHPSAGETYLVGHSEVEGGLVLRLLHHTPRVLSPGCYAPGMVDSPLMQLWMVSGPDTLTLVRDGRVIHPGGGR
ncbi:MAG TPA: hypothetical protein VFF37_06655 [Streptomyces sp.]|nr:hypothetical protein [Streptomyces sp.]